MPRCTTALTLISRFSGAITMPIAVMKPMNDGCVEIRERQYMTAATPSATAYCVSESPSAWTATSRTLKRKLRAFTSSNWRRSCSCPSKIFTTRWPCSDCSVSFVTSPIECWIREL